QFVEVLGQAIEALVPEPLEGLDPVVNGLEPSAVEPVESLPPRTAHADQAHLAQNPQVLGDLGLRDVERIDDVVDGLLALSEQVEDLPPPGFGDGVEDVGGCWGACHARIVFRYGNMSRAEGRRDEGTRKKR